MINKGQRCTPKGANTLTERLSRRPVGKRVSTAIGNGGVIGGGARSSSFSFPKEEEESAVDAIMPPRNTIEIRIPQTARGGNKDLELDL